jgi:hypothetical protein
MSAQPQTDPEVMTDEEAVALFDALARELLGISGKEFLQRFDAGEYAGRDEPGIIDLVILLPLARRTNGVANPR